MSVNAVLPILKKKKPFLISRALIHIFMSLFIVISIMPFVLIITSSLMHERDIFISGYSYWPGMGFTTAAYEFLFKNPMLLVRSFITSVTVTAIGTLFGALFTLSLGYTLTRPDYILKRPIAFIVFFTMIFNGGIVPYYIMIAGTFKMYNNYWVLLFGTGGLLCNALYVLLAKGMLSSVPGEVIDSAKIDGANEFSTYWRIVLPISKPAITTVGLFIAIQYWNDWMTCLYFIDDSKKFTLQYLLVRMAQNIKTLATEMQFSGSRVTMNTPVYSARMAMCVLATLPIIFVYPFVQKYFEKGIVIGSVKG